jgi:hypothetical protein
VRVLLLWFVMAFGFFTWGCWNNPLPCGPGTSKSGLRSFSVMPKHWLDYARPMPRSLRHGPRPARVLALLGMYGLLLGFLVIGFVFLFCRLMDKLFLGR